MVDSFIPDEPVKDSFVPDQPAAPADSFIPDTPSPAPATVPADSFTPDVPKPVAAPEGLLSRTLMATPRQAAAGFESMQAAGQPGLPFTQRLLRSAGGLAQVASAVPPFAQAAQLGGEAFAAAEPKLEVMPKIAAGIQATTGMPLAQGPIPQDIETMRSLGEVAGASAVPVGTILRAAKSLRGAIPGRIPAGWADTGKDLGGAVMGGLGKEAEAAAPAVAPAVEAAAPAAAEAAAPSIAGDFLKATEKAPPAATPQSVNVLKKVISGARRLSATDSPSDFARGNASAEKLVEAMQDRAITSHVMEEDLTRQVATNFKPLGKDQNAITRVTSLLDTKGGSQVAKDVLTPVEYKVYQAQRAWFDQLATAMGLEPDQRITDYFPRLREQLGVVEKKIVKVGKNEVPTYMTDVTPNRLVKQWFEKPRVSAAPADDLGMDPIIAYAKGAAHKIAFGGGTHPITGETITPVLDEIAQHLPGIPQDKTKYFADYVNDVLGVPHRGKPNEVSQQMIEANKALRSKIGTDVLGLEFGRTIAGNIMTPIHKLTQTILALGHMSPTNWVKGWGGVVKAATNPAEWERLRQLGVISSPSSADAELMAQVGGGSGFGGVIQKAAGLFKTTKNINRIQTYTGAIAEAADRGLTGAAAERFARNVTRDVHFTFGTEDASEAARSIRNPLVRSTLQYKPFPIKFGIALKQMAADDIKDLPKFASALGKGDISGALSAVPTRTIKVMGTMGGLFGAGAVIPTADQLFNLDPNSFMSKGLVGSMGVSLGQMMGTGVLPLDSLQHLIYFLPGPLIAHALDGASAGMSLATGAQYNFDLPSVVQGKGGKVSNVIDPELTTSRLVRAVPLAGVQADRIRKGVIHYRSQAPNAQREPVTFAQALAFDPLTSGNRQIRSVGQTEGPLSAVMGRQGAESLRIGMGLREQRNDAIQKLTQQLARDTELDRADAHAAAERLVAGDSAGANAIIQRRGGPPGMGGVMDAVKAAALPPEIRKGLRAPLPLRGKFLGTLPNLPGEE